MSMGKAKAKITAAGSVNVIRRLLGGGIDTAMVRGYGRIWVQDPYGVADPDRDTGWVKNNFVNGGKAFAANKCSGYTTPADMEFLAVGTDNTAESDADTLLGAEINTNGLIRTIGTVSIETTATADDTMKIIYAWSVTGTSTIWEIGLFNIVTYNTVTMMARTLLGTSVTVNNLDTCNGEYKIIFA